MHDILNHGWICTQYSQVQGRLQLNQRVRQVQSTQDRLDTLRVIFPERVQQLKR